MGKGGVEDRGLDLGCNAVRVRALGAGQAVYQAVRPIGLKVRPDFVELQPGIARHFVGAAHIRQFSGDFEQRQFAIHNDRIYRLPPQSFECRKRRHFFRHSHGGQGFTARICAMCLAG